MRSTLDLIEELEMEADRATIAALAVGFESTTIFVISDQPDRQELLDEAVSNGGVPIGLAIVKVDETKHQSTLETHVFPEHPIELSQPFMNGLVEKFRELLKTNYPNVESWEEPEQ